MNLFFVRHGDTDYRLVESRGVRGWATSFAPLTPLGRLQIDTIARDYRLQEAQAIVCSSYARALESAARLSRELNKPLYVEYDLHEWLPQKDSLADLDPRLLHRANEQLRRQMQGSLEAGDVPWESLDEVRQRVVSVLNRYRHMNSMIVVTHAVVISALAGMERLVDHAEIVPVELDLDALDFVPRAGATSRP
ncbi:MAG: histidine phosphatase family protein [Trueperaceae bacterium]